MRRYFLVTLLIGGAVSAAVLLLAQGGVFGPFSGALAEWYGAAGFPVAGGGGGGSSPAGSPLVEQLLAVAVAFGAAWCVIDIPHPGHKLLVAVLLLLVLAGLSPALALYGVAFGPFPALGSAALAVTAGLFYSGTEPGMRKRLLLEAVGSRISQPVFENLVNGREPLRLSPGTRDVSVLVCRVFNQAELRERLSPADLVSLGNLFHRTTAGFLMDRGAYLDESSPDLVRVFFGLLPPREDHALEACRAALELRTRLRILSDECEARWFQRLDCGVGISSGPMTVGVYGSPGHHHYTGVGGDADFARTLARANRHYGSDVLISSRGYQFAGEGVEVRPLEMIHDPEKHLLSEVYQLLAMAGNLSDSDRARRDAFWQGVIWYRAGRFEDALARFEQAAPPGGEDAPLRFFVDRCRSRRPGSGAAVPADRGHARLLSDL